MMTPYSKAWQKFKNSKEFTKIADPTTVSNDGSERRYLENRLQQAFDAGWNSKTSLILDALKQVLEKND